MHSNLRKILGRLRADIWVGVGLSKLVLYLFLPSAFSSCAKGNVLQASVKSPQEGACVRRLGCDHGRGGMHH